MENENIPRMKTFRAAATTTTTAVHQNTTHNSVFQGAFLTAIYKKH